MKQKVSISHDEALIGELRNDRAYCAAYLQAAMDDTGEPKVLLTASRQIAEGRGGPAKVLHNRTNGGGEQEA
jgi:DNA-binding phage protein